MIGRSLLGLLLLLALLSPAQGTVVWSEDFTGEGPTDGTINPTSDYPGGTAGEDWTIVNSSTSTSSDGITNFYISNLGATGPTLTVYDTTTSAEATARVNFSQFSSFNTATPGQQIFRFSFDFRVDNFSTDTTNTGSAPRLVLVPKNNTANAIVIGFGIGNAAATTASGNELFFYLGTGAVAPVPASASSTAIGVSGTAFAPDFDFGIYDATVPGGTTPGNTSNDTAIGAGTDEEYRFQIDYQPTTGSIIGTATRLSNSASVTFSRTGAVLANLNNTDGSYFILQSGQSSENRSHWDNFQFEVIPEPSAAGLLGLGVAASLLRRRR